VSKLKAHLPKDNETTLCGRSRSGGTEVLVGPLRAQLFKFVCKRCIDHHNGPLAPNLEPGEFTVASEKWK
jgi:hypothetical protein